MIFLDVLIFMEKYYFCFKNKKILELEGCYVDLNRVYINLEELLEKGNIIKVIDFFINIREEEIWLFNIVVILFKRIMVYFYEK